MKTTYILLRNNHESGPHSEETLKTLGLRPDDLIWVEGQSVYWQHPSDFKELQSFISDQPAQPAVKQPTIEEDWEKYSPGNTVKAVPVAPIPDFKEEETSIQPIYFPEKKKRSKTITLIFRPATQNVALYAGLLIAGIAAGMVISKKGNKGNNSLANAALNNEAPAARLITPSSENTDTTSFQSGSKSSSVDTINAVPPVQTAQTISISEQTNTERNLAKTNTLTEEKDSPDIKETTQSVPEKTDPPPVEKEDKPSRAEISSQVSVKTNDYIVAAFGGIRDLELTVRNNSKFPLDKVIVELTYLKPRDEFLRSENISIRDVPAEGKLTVPVKKSNRGVKVTCKVVKVEY